MAIACARWCDDERMARKPEPHHYPVPSDEDIARANLLLRQIGGSNVSWGAANVFEVLVGEHRMAVENMTAERLMRATWVLAGATVVLAVATIALIFATLAS
jgi:hypothetical protein